MELGACVTLSYHFHHDLCQLKHALFWHKQKKRQERVWESTQFVVFKPWKVPLVDIQEKSPVNTMQNPAFQG